MRGLDVLAALVADALALTLSCASAAHCSAGGTYIDSSGNQQAFVVIET